MKGMEGEADANNDNEITAGELNSMYRPMSYNNDQVHRHLSCKVMDRVLVRLMSLLFVGSTTTIRT